MNPFRTYHKAICTFLMSIGVCLGLSGQDVHTQSQKQDDYSSQNLPNEKSKGDNKVTIPQLFFSGILVQNEGRQQVWYIPSLFEQFPANTVEGFVFNPHVSVTRHLKDGKFYNLKPHLRYGFGNKRLQAQLSAQLYYAPAHKASIQLSGGRFVEQFNTDSPLNALNNTLYTFLSQDNFLKIYEKDYLKISHIISPIKDVLLTTTLSWNNRKPLQNLPKYDKEDSAFTSNTPINNELDNTSFKMHQALLWNAQLRWQFGHQYIRHRGVFKSLSPYPSITLSYSGSADGVLGSDLSYQKIALKITQDFKVGKWGSGQFFLETGDFIAKDTLSFIDFKHFNGNRTLYSKFRIGDFQLLDYYQYSTTNFYLQVHYEHQMNPLAFGKRKVRIQPIVSFNYLYTPNDNTYWELGIGANIFGLWRLEFYNSWRTSSHENFGVRLGIILN